MKILVAGDGGIKLADLELLRGRAGENGRDGEQGPIGLQGPGGETGAPGRDGADGPEGPIGLQGPAGLAGRDGIDGLIGPQGPRGLDGLMGPQGPQGMQGLQGIDGLRGDRGPQGIPGKDGEPFRFPMGKADEVWTQTSSGAAWRPLPFLGGPGRRVKFGEIEVRLAALEAGGGGGGSGVSSAYVNSLFALKTSIPDVSGFANSSDVSSANATFATSAFVNDGLNTVAGMIPSVAAYATSADVSSRFAALPTWATSAWVLGLNYTNSVDVSSFYALKTSLATYATSADVSSGFAASTSKAFAMTAAAIRF